MNNLKNIDVLILCGGKGSKLQSVVSDRPKPLADINGKPFISILIESLYLQGFRKIILCTGYMKEQFEIELPALCNHDDLSIFLSEEPIPLGTGGAIKNAKSLIASTSFLVLNGDSFCNVDYDELIRFHRTRHALISIVVTNIKNTESPSIVTLADSNEILQFGQDLLINTGIYYMSTDIFRYMKDETFSFENDFLSNLTKFSKYIETARSTCYGFRTLSEFIDIETPEKYEKAKEILRLLT